MEGVFKIELRVIGTFRVLSEDIEFIKELREATNTLEKFNYRKKVMTGDELRETSTVRFISKEHRERISIKIDQSSNSSYAHEDEDYHYFFYNLMQNNHGFLSRDGIGFYPNNFILVNKSNNEVESFKSFTDVCYDKKHKANTPRFNYFIGDNGGLIRVSISKDKIKFNKSNGVLRSEKNPYLRLVIKMAEPDVYTEDYKQVVTYEMHELVALGFGDQYFIERFDVNSFTMETHHRDGNTLNNKKDNVIMLPSELHDMIHAGMIWLKEEDEGIIESSDLNKVKELMYELSYKRQLLTISNK